MSQQTQPRKRPSPSVPIPRQKAIPFESTLTRGLTASERTKVVKQLSHLLVLAAGLANQESDVER
jgi:hypothetical protein